jgi:hypothetical protein
VTEAHREAEQARKQANENRRQAAETRKQELHKWRVMLAEAAPENQEMRNMMLANPDVRITRQPYPERLAEKAA